DNVWAAGYSCSDVVCGTLVERWDGISWSIITSSNVNVENHLYGIAATSTSDIWAVGDWSLCYACLTHTLTEHYTNSCMTPLPTTTSTSLPNATVTPTSCMIPFTDIHPSDYFYEAVRYLYCHGAIS